MTFQLTLKGLSKGAIRLLLNVPGVIVLTEDRLLLCTYRSQN